MSAFQRPPVSGASGAHHTAPGGMGLCQAQCSCGGGSSQNHLGSCCNVALLWMRDSSPSILKSPKIAKTCHGVIESCFAYNNLIPLPYLTLKKNNSHPKKSSIKKYCSPEDLNSVKRKTKRTYANTLAVGWFWCHQGLTAHLASHRHKYFTTRGKQKIISGFRDTLADCFCLQTTSVP